MFDFHCPSCDRRLVLFPSQVKHVINDDHGITVIVDCWCGELGAIRSGAKEHAGSVAEDALALAC
jgi:hypothetical protein